MKIILEVNTERKQDIKEALDTLSVLTPNEYKKRYLNVQEDNASEKSEKYIEVNVKKEDIDADGFNIPDISDILSSENSDVLGGNDSIILKAEIEDLKATIESLRKEKAEINKEKKSLEENVKSLQLQVEGMPSMVGDEEDGDIELYKSQIAKLQDDVEFHKGRSDKNWEELKQLRSTIDGLNVEKSKNLKKIAELEKDVEFHKGRSDKNWEELKKLKTKLKELENVEVDSSNSEEIEKLKAEWFQTKSEYENTIGELKLVNDKLENELNLCKSKFTDEELKEYDNLKKIRDVICDKEKGRELWENVENNIKNLYH